MTDGAESNKRAAPATGFGPNTSDILKRARKPTDHAEECDDVECKGCASGAIVFDSDILNLSAGELVAIAEQEEEDGASNSVVNKLYETALDRYAGEVSLAHARALLQFAEYVGYREFASEALKIAEKVLVEDNMGKARQLLIQGRAHMLLVCLDPTNWCDPRDGSSDEDSEHCRTAVLSAADKETLDRGIEEVSHAQNLLFATQEYGSTALSAAKSTMLSLLALHERHSLVSHLRIAIMNCALEFAYSVTGWCMGSDSAATHNSSSNSNSDMCLLACKISVAWALAAAESTADGEQIKTRVAPAVKYLEAHTAASAASCKLYAQLLIVLSSILEDEDEVISAYESAIDALKQAHKLRPDDEDVICQLEDMGVEL
ncbi:hypothetical protein BX070DRAFT_224224 [Coemansia spiralis]|nr:hypothetical protein BX070DRAFT_224224 [Coemansia spiralis]